MPPPPPLISQTFTTLKTHLLQSLSVPPSAYTDASPKGTLDTAIVPLIGRLNALEGVVSTSSCAGRVSVFLEGRKGGSGGVVGKKGGEGVVGDGDEEKEEGIKSKRVMKNGKKGGERIVPGGKGMGGRWLFVSHEAVEMPGHQTTHNFTKLFGLTGQDTSIRNDGEHGHGRRSSYTKNARFVRFAFEPMILHIATASLSHAAPILSAAISAGFRESGVQSLKNLTDPNAITMVAVRSAGLAFESVIGIVRGDQVQSPDRCASNDDGRQAAEVIEALVGEEYLEMLVDIANERFEANSERIRRFEAALFGGMEKKMWGDWEDKETRQERKKAEGLRRRDELKANHNLQGPVDGGTDESDMKLGQLEELK